MKQKILCFSLSLFICSSYALPSMVSEEEDWLHSDIKRCVMSHQSRLDHQLVVKAEKGDRVAQLQLASFLLTGTKLPYSPKQAYHWLNKAAAQGSPKAMYLLGAMYEEGKVVLQDLHKASSYYEQALNAGEKDAITDWVRVSRTFFVSEMNTSHMMDTLLQHAKTGSAKAQLLYGIELMQNQSGEARSWLLKAADKGVAKAYYYLGLAFLQDEDVTSLDVNALHWITSQARQEQGEYAYLVGLLYHFGYGVDQDQEQASFYLEIANKKGYDIPKQLLDS